MPQSEIRLVPLSHPGTGEIILPEKSFLIGREAQPFLRLEDSAFRKLSRQHARFAISPDAITLADLGSSNGTTVNGERLDTQPRRIADGDEICFAGAIRFRVKYTPLADQNKTLFTGHNQGKQEVPPDKTMFISSGDSYLDLLCEDEEATPDENLKKRSSSGWKKKSVVVMAIGLIILLLVASYFFLAPSKAKKIENLSLQRQFSVVRMD